MKQHTNLCIANAKPSAFINECTFVNCWSDGIWCPTEHRDVLKSQLARPLASCSVLFQLWLVACHIQKDLRELLRSTGLQWCFSSWYAHPPSTDSFISLKAGTPLYMQMKTSVCAYVKLNIPIDMYYYTHCFQYPCSISIRCSLSCFVEVGPHTQSGVCSGSVICTDKSV